MSMNLTFTFQGFSTDKTMYANNCSNCHIFESDARISCPLFIRPPPIPEQGEVVEFGTEDGLVKFMCAMTCLLKCEYHVSKERVERMNNEPVRKKGRFDTLDLESE